MFCVYFKSNVRKLWVSRQQDRQKKYNDKMHFDYLYSLSRFLHHDGIEYYFNPKHGRPLWKGVWWKVCKLHNSRGHFSKDRMSRLLTYCPRLLLSTDQLIKSYLSFRLGVLSQMTFRLHFSMSWGPGAIASVFVDLGRNPKSLWAS